VSEHDLWNDLQPLLDQELSRLSDTSRAVIILCDLEGKTRKEAARQLGLAEGTVGSRLARARVLLAKRLARHGLAVSGGALATVLAQQASASVPTAVVSATIQAASLYAAGQAAVVGVISGKVTALTEGVLKTMLFTKLKLVLVVLALVFGGSASVWVNKVIQAPPPVTETVPVVVAAREVPRFTTLSADMLKTRDFPKGLVPPGALTKVEDAVDRATYSPLVTGELLLEGKLAVRGAGRGMAAIIPKGMRGFTIPTPNIAAGVAGFILPGNKVDVLLTVSGSGLNDAPTRTVTLLQGVEILAVDQRVEAPAENKVDAKELRSVTLLVTPDQAAKLDLGQNKGVLHLSLRNPEDQVAANARPASLGDLGLGEDKPREAPKPEKPAPLPPPPPPPEVWVRTLRGTTEGGVLLQPVAPPGR
jgi:Flp pilus assembly protein CpaB